jgi:hypothetical protein
MSILNSGYVLKWIILFCFYPIVLHKHANTQVYNFLLWVGGLGFDLDLKVTK